MPKTYEVTTTLEDLAATPLTFKSLKALIVEQHAHHRRKVKEKKSVWRYSGYLWLLVGALLPLIAFKHEVPRDIIGYVSILHSLISGIIFFLRPQESLKLHKKTEAQLEGLLYEIIGNETLPEEERKSLDFFMNAFRVIRIETSEACIVKIEKDQAAVESGMKKSLTVSTSAATPTAS